MKQIPERELLSMFGMAPDADRFREVLSDFFRGIEYHDVARVIQDEMNEPEQEFDF